MLNLTAQDIKGTVFAKHPTGRAFLISLESIFSVQTFVMPM